MHVSPGNPDATAKRAVPLDRGVSHGGLFHVIFLHRTDFQRRQQAVHGLAAIGPEEVDGNRLGHAGFQAGQPGFQIGPRTGLASSAIISLSARASFARLS